MGPRKRSQRDLHGLEDLVVKHARIEEPGEAHRRQRNNVVSVRFAAENYLQTAGFRRFGEVFRLYGSPTVSAKLHFRSYMFFEVQTCVRLRGKVCIHRGKINCTFPPSLIQKYFICSSMGTF